MLSEPAKAYFETLSEHEKELYKSFSVAEKGQMNKLCEDLFHNSQKGYQKGLVNGSIPTSISADKYSGLVADNKEKAINELSKLFSKEAIQKREEWKAQNKNNILAQKYGTINGKDVENIKKYEKTTGQSILNKYARTGMQKDPYKKAKDKKIGFDMGK